MFSRWIACLLTASFVATGMILDAPIVRAAEDDTYGVEFNDEATDEVTTAEVDTSNDVETIRERYSNRAVKIEREVIRDDEDNYVNHGAWRMWDQAGNMFAKGQYEDGKRLLLRK